MEDDKPDPFDDPTEQAHFKQVVSAFFNYSVCINLLIVFIDRCYEGYSENGRRFYQDRPQILEITFI